MPDFFTLNGINIPIADSAFSEGQILIGDEGRAFSGAKMDSTRAIKRRWSGQTTILDPDTATAVKALLTGLGHTLSFNDSTYYLYTSKGQGPTSGTGTYRTATPSPKFGAGYVRLAAGASLTYPAGLGANWTLMTWVYESGAWHHYIRCSDGTKYKDGATYGSAIPFLSVSGSSAVLGDSGSGSNQDFDDAVFLPYVIPAAWAAVWGVASSAFSALPDLTLSGECVPASTTVTAPVGSVEGVYVQYQDGGASAWIAAGRRVSFDVEEV